MSADINTLAVPLWIMAGLSILEALVLIAMVIGGYVLYSRVMTLVGELEAKHVAPLREKTEDILADVKVVTARVAQQTERVDHAINGTIDRVDETAARVRAGVHDRVSQAAGVLRGVRAVIIALLHKESHA
jgi:hypothetical protein